MRKKNIIYLRDFLRGLKKYNAPIGFSMSRWVGRGREPGHECGTTACLGGWCDILFTKAGKVRAKPEFSVRKLDRLNREYFIAGFILGLDPVEANELFFMGNTNVTMSSVDVPHACRVLTRLSKTGKVDWSV